MKKMFMINRDGSKVELGTFGKVSYTIGALLLLGGVGYGVYRLTTWLESRETKIDLIEKET